MIVPFTIFLMVVAVILFILYVLFGGILGWIFGVFIKAFWEGMKNPSTTVDKDSQ